MAHRIILGEDYEGIKKGQMRVVTSTKLKQMIEDKIKFTNRIVSGTSTRKIEFEKKEKQVKSK